MTQARGGLAQDYASIQLVLASVSSWILDYNGQRPHQSLNYRTRRRLDQRNPQPDLSTAGGVITRVSFIESRESHQIPANKIIHIQPKFLSAGKVPRSCWKLGW
jgi:hypothetical protein